MDSPKLPGIREDNLLLQYRNMEEVASSIIFIISVYNINEEFCHVTLGKSLKFGISIVYICFKRSMVI